MEKRFQYSFWLNQRTLGLISIFSLSVASLGCLEYATEFQKYTVPKIVFSTPTELIANNGYMTNPYYDFQSKIFFQNSLDSNFWSIDCYSGAIADSGLPANSIGWMGPANNNWFVYQRSNELYRTNGVSEGLLMDIHTSGNSNPDYFYNLMGKAIFGADDGTNGREPWLTDGTVAGTAMLKDLNVGAGGSSPMMAFEYNDKVYFRGTDGTRWQLFETDYTVGGTVATNATVPLVAGMPNMKLGSIGGFYPIIYDNKLWFTGNNGTSGNEPWYYDFDTDTSTQIADLRPGFAGGMKLSDVPYHIFDNKLYFIGWSAVDKYEVWVHDPVLTTTTQVSSGCKNAGMGASPIVYLGSKGLVFFCQVTGLTGYQVFVSDGTPGGTQRVPIYDAGDTAITPTAGFWMIAQVNGKVLFLTDDATSTGQQLWESDGSVAGTVKVSNHCNSMAMQHRVFAAGDHVIYSADDDCDSVGSMFIYTP